MHCVDSLALPPTKLLQGHAIHHLCHDTLLYFTQQTCFNLKILKKRQHLVYEDSWETSG